MEKWKWTRAFCCYVGIHVVFSLKGVPADKIESAQRAHDVFKMKCPVYRSVHSAIDVTTELMLDSETQPI